MFVYYAMRHDLCSPLSKSDSQSLHIFNNSWQARKLWDFDTEIDIDINININIELNIDIDIDIDNR